VSVDQSERRQGLAYAYENPRPDVQALVPPGVKRILDLGCSSGVLGAALKTRQGAEVVGVEIDPEYVADAERRLDRVIHRDLEKLFSDRQAVAELGRFDCLIAADVLEHLRDPWMVLREAAALLDAGGTAVISLPNIRFWETFWELGVKGRWPLRGIGIFDRTHLRFFTASDALELLQQAGLDAAEISRQYRMRSEPNRYDRHAARFASTPLRPFFVFQHVIRARKL
jgi:methionine biosynthesis protein MetW